MEYKKYQCLGIDVHIDDKHNIISVDDKCIEFEEHINHNRTYFFKKDDPKYNYLNFLFSWAYFCEIVIFNRPIHPQKCILIDKTSSRYELIQEYSKQEVEEIYKIILNDIKNNYNTDLVFEGIKYHLNRESLISAYQLIESDAFYSYILNELIDYYNINLHKYFSHLYGQVFIKSLYNVRINQYKLRICNVILNPNIGYKRYIYANATPSTNNNKIIIKDLKITEDKLVYYIGWADIRRMMPCYSKDKLNTKDGIIEFVNFIRSKCLVLFDGIWKIGIVSYNHFNKTVSFKIYKY